MKLSPSDPDVETIVSRISKEDLDLQPNFQRGEVWSQQKKQRLIDTILRDWHVPPVHLVALKNGKEQVLDGQQRLAAIRDFHSGKLTIDGNIPPQDDAILKLHGSTYANLPDDWKRKFDRFTIRVIRLTDFLPEEPGELFFRLNQPTNLTAAEQRNAFYGPTRQQVKELVGELAILGIDKDLIGFSNSRMAYDDVIARVCFSLDEHTLTAKVTAPDLAERYRSQVPFSSDAVRRCFAALSLLSCAKPFITWKLRFNKATLYSWLVFVADAMTLNPPILDARALGAFLSEFEHGRAESTSELRPLKVSKEHQFDSSLRSAVYGIYNDRSSSRVADVSSVLLRDMTLWIMFLDHLLWGNYTLPSHRRIEILLARLQRLLRDRSLEEHDFENLAKQTNWGIL